MCRMTWHLVDHGFPEKDAEIVCRLFRGRVPKHLTLEHVLAIEQDVESQIGKNGKEAQPKQKVKITDPRKEPKPEQIPDYICESTASPNQRHYWQLDGSDKGVCKYCEEQRNFALPDRKP